jgi:hypothetical protein
MNKVIKKKHPIKAAMLDPTLYLKKTNKIDEDDKFIAENGVDERLACLEIKPDRVKMMELK